jgi:hypothetical protein
MMKIVRIDLTQARPDPSRADSFAGDVAFQPLVGPADSDELDLLTVSFSAGARNLALAWGGPPLGDEPSLCDEARADGVDG